MYVVAQLTVRCKRIEVRNSYYIVVRCTTPILHSSGHIFAINSAKNTIPQAGIARTLQQTPSGRPRVASHRKGFRLRDGLHVRPMERHRPFDAQMRN